MHLRHPWKIRQEGALTRALSSYTAARTVRYTAVFLFFTNQQVTAGAVPGLSPIRHAPLHKKTSFPRNSGKDVFAIGPMRASEEKDSGEPQENEETAAIGDSRQENT